MNRYRKARVIVVKEYYTLHSITVKPISNTSNIRLFGGTCGLNTTKVFETKKDMISFCLKLMKNNYFKPVIIERSNDTVIYDIDFIDITTPYEINRYYTFASDCQKGGK